MPDSLSNTPDQRVDQRAPEVKQDMVTLLILFEWLTSGREQHESSRYADTLLTRFYRFGPPHAGRGIETNI